MTIGAEAKKSRHHDGTASDILLQGYNTNPGVQSTAVRSARHKLHYKQTGTRGRILYNQYEEWVAMKRAASRPLSINEGSMFRKALILKSHNRQ